MARPTGVTRVTIDVTVARDFIDDPDARHGDAVTFFTLARKHAIEVAAASSGLIFDLYGDLLSRSARRSQLRESRTQLSSLTRAC